MQEKPAQPDLLHTLPGIVAILLWSSNFAFTRVASEQLGVGNAGMLAMLVGGAIGVAYLGIVSRTLGALLTQPLGYFLGAGVMAVLNLVCTYLVVGLAAERAQVVELSLINYLWPGLTILLSVPMQRKRARPWLLPGVLLAFVGVGIAVFRGHLPAWADFSARVAQNWPVYLLAHAAAVSWALYSNISRRWASKATVSGMPLFVLAAGLLLIPLRPLLPAGTAHWSVPGALSLLYLAVGPTLLGYLLWDQGVRHGRLTLLVSLSNFTPLFATILTSLLLGIALAPGIWLAVACIIAGALVCNHAIPEEG